MKNLILYFIFNVIFNESFAGIHIGPGMEYKNIQAVSAVLSKGDTVFLHSGSYTGYQFVVGLKGSSKEWITITRYQDDEITISGGWQFSKCEFIKFQNLDFKANSAYPGRLFHVENGGSCETQSRYIRVDSCRFSGVTDPNAISAFKFGGVDNFEVTNCVFKDIPNCSAFDFNVCRNGIINRNRIENCLTGGHIKGGASNITIQGNLFLNASASPWVAFELGGDTGEQFYCPGDEFEVKNLKFHSNIISGGYRGLALSSARDCEVINNTFYNFGQATLRFLNTSSLYPDLMNNTIVNNLFAFSESAYINGSFQKTGAAAFSGNIYYSMESSVFNGPYWDSPELDLIKEVNPKVFGSETPMFSDAENLDFRLVNESPAIGAAITVDEPKSDFLGNLFNKTTRSVGAIEFNTETFFKDLSESCEFILFPNPANDYVCLLGTIPNPGIFQIIITDIVGRIYFEFDYQSNTELYNFDISELLPGAYVLLIKTSGNFLNKAIFFTKMY